MEEDKTFKKLITSDIESSIAKAIGNIAKKECTCKIEKISYSNDAFGTMKLSIEIDQVRKTPDWKKNI